MDQEAHQRAMQDELRLPDPAPEPVAAATAPAAQVPASVTTKLLWASP